MKIHPLIENAYKVLDGGELTQADALRLMEGVEGSDILDLISLANKVREKFAAGPRACSILNAKSGVCTQDCRFCAQSARHDTGIDTYPLLSIPEVLAAADAVVASGVRTFGYVTSGYGYLDENDEEFRQVLATLDALHERHPDLYLCVSVGILSKETARALAAHHADRYNMNLQTNPERYAELIATTHSIIDKVQTIQHLQEFGMEICCGGIIGLGEGWSDRVAMAAAIRNLKVDGAPLNVLIPIAGTPLEHVRPITPAEVAKSFCLFRLMNPAILLKFAAGRETVMKDFQGLLMLCGLNSLMTGGYLTTRGRSVEEDRVLLRQLGDFGAGPEGREA